MVRFKIFTIIFISIIISFPLYSQTYPIKKIDEFLKIGIDKIINQKYNQADSIFTLLKKSYPKLPLGNIYLAANEIARKFDLSEKFNDRLIINNLDEAEKISNSLIEQNEKNYIWDIYFLALTEGYKAYYKALDKNWLVAFDEGFNSISNFKRCINIDSAFYESYTALGTYIYWKSSKTEALNWLPFITDEKQKGISLLKIAIQNSSYNKYLAVNSLQWILIDEERYNEAAELSLHIISEYPDSRIFKWALARAYEDIDKRKSIAVYFEILNSYKKDNSLNNINHIILLHLIAQQYQQIGEISEALKLCKIILNIKLNDFEKDKLDNRIERVLDLEKELLRR